jgi:head-tail adaptor
MIHFNTKVNILRVTKTTNPGGLGGYTEAENVLHENLPCRINWKKGSEKIWTDKNTYFRDARLYCRVVDMTTKDKLQYNDTIYDIVDVNNVDEADRFIAVDFKLIQ